jgi:hypothetical protein
MFFYSLALCVIDLSDSALYLHERCLQLAGLVVVIDTTDDLNSEFFPMKSVGPTASAYVNALAFNECRQAG